MAHACPDCGMTCHCNGDIDDCLLDFEEDINNCTHCDCPRCGNNREFCECREEWDDEWSWPTGPIVRRPDRM